MLLEKGTTERQSIRDERAGTNEALSKFYAREERWQRFIATFKAVMWGLVLLTIVGMGIAYILGLRF